MTQYLGIAPNPDESSQAYWQACRKERLLFQCCAACGHRQFYPRPFCTVCLSDRVEWTQASGKAKLHTYSVVYRTSDVRFTDLLPYVLAIVELAEGPRMMARIVNCSPDALRSDQPLSLCFEGRGDYSLPQFELAKEEVA